MVVTVPCMCNVVQCLKVSATHRERVDSDQSSIPASCCKCRPQICIPCLEDDEVFVPQHRPWEKRKSFINCVAVFLYFLPEKNGKLLAFSS